MKLRLTPLNIVSSILLVSIAYLLIYPDQNGWRGPGSLPLFLMFALSFITDLVFRRLIRDIKRIWLFELVFLIFVAVFMVLIRMYLFD